MRHFQSKKQSSTPELTLLSGPSSMTTYRPAVRPYTQAKTPSLRLIKTYADEAFVMPPLASLESPLPSNYAPKARFFRLLVEWLGLGVVLALPLYLGLL